MNADLHFHPGFRSRDLANRYSRVKTPSMEEIVYKAMARNIGILAITSCSNATERDKRWDAYFAEREPVRGFKLITTASNNKGLMYHANQPTADKRDYAVYVFHGQEFKTDLLDVNILFAEREVLVKPSKTDAKKVDFYYILDAAKDSGKNVVTAVRPLVSGIGCGDRGMNMKLDSIVDLYEKGKIDIFERYDALDSVAKNRQCDWLTSILKAPGVAVSDAHRLKDLGVAYTILENLDNPEFLMSSSFNIATIAEEIKQGRIRNVKQPIPLVGKLIYLKELVDSIAFDRFRTKD